MGSLEVRSRDLAARPRKIGSGARRYRNKQKALRHNLQRTVQALLICHEAVAGCAAHERNELVKTPLLLEVFYPMRLMDTKEMMKSVALQA